MNNDEQFLILATIFDYVAALIHAFRGDKNSANFFAILGFAMSLLWMWKY